MDHKSPPIMKTNHMLLTIFPLLPIPTHSQNFDTLGDRVVFYPASLMLSHNPRPLFFFNDTKLLHVTITLPAIEGGKRVRLLSAKCFAPQSKFFHRIHDSTKNIQKVACRLLSLPGYPNLLECDNYLSRYFQYSTGIPSTMTCPRGYRQTIAECKAWALKPCKGISNNEAHWLKSNRRTSRSMGVPRGWFRSF